MKVVTVGLVAMSALIAFPAVSAPAGQRTKEGLADVKDVKVGDGVEAVKAALSKHYSNVECRKNYCRASSTQPDRTGESINISFSESMTVYDIRFEGRYVVAQSQDECIKIMNTSYDDWRNKIGAGPRPTGGFSSGRKDMVGGFVPFEQSASNVSDGASFNAQCNSSSAGQMLVNIVVNSPREQQKRPNVTTSAPPKF